MSLLGKLLSGIPSNGSSTAKSKTPLDSNLEDQFTHNLLFPDADALCHNDQVFPLSSGTVLAPAAVNHFDINGDIDLDMRDVRVIIMQEATPTSGSAQLLYDSHTPPPPPPSLSQQPPSNGTAYQPRAEGRRSISSPRKASLGQNSRPVVIQQETTAPRTFGAFDRRPAHHKALSYTETEGQRSAREYREEMTTFSNCIFGNSEVLAYKGTGTKVHILPSESRVPFTSSSYGADANGSLGRSSMRSSKLAQSFTSDNFASAPISAGCISPNPSSRGTERKKVLITRMFPVPLPNDDIEDASQIRTPTQNAQATDAAGYPFPQVGDHHGATDKRLQPKQKRTPMYAVGLIIHLPAAPHVPSVPVSRSSLRGPGSYTEQDSFPSSFNSARRAGWTMLGTGFGVDSLDSSISSEVDDRIDLITQHWDIIMRTLSHLQTVATTSLLPLLKQADVSSPDPRANSSSHHRVPSASVSISGKRVMEDIKPFKVPKTNAKFVQLQAGCLMHALNIQKEVDISRQRIISGIKAYQVVTGQGRWGIWREEARLVGKWAGSKDEGFFFFNLLTGFLGHHTEWLQALGPSWYRRRHYQHQRANKDDDISLPTRTIIVSDNKLMARRLIFLLSAFLPANPQLNPPRMHRPSTSTSFGGYSQSPPMYTVPILREESLRRRMNKRTGASRGAHSRTMSFPAQTMQGPPTHLPPDIHHDRRPSDATSMKTANLPIPGSDLETRKSSTATISTATPVTTMPHFSTRRPMRVGTGPGPRPDSSGSLAADDLLRFSLKRGESSGQYSNTSCDSQGQNSRWGSMISGFWSAKRRGSTAATDVEPPRVDGVENVDPLQKDKLPNKHGKLVEMVEEASCSQVIKTKEQQERELRKSDSGSSKTAKPDNEEPGEVSEQVIHTSQRVPDPSGAYESPVKTSINEMDGVIDIDVPLPDYLSFETAVSSPSSSGYLSTPGFGNGMDGFEHYSRTGPELDTTTNVGGWLQRYHPDFALQAIPVQDGILEEVKASMREEPTPLFSGTPLPDNGRSDRWVDVCSAIIADTTNFSIKRIRYRRLVKPKDISTPNVALDSRYGNVYSAAQLTPALEAYETHIEERFIEEPIISMDETLIQAVERIIAQSGQTSKESSVCSSRSTSRKRGNRDRSNSDAKLPVRNDRNLEIPRNECKKMVLGALEEIVKEVEESRKDGDDAEREQTESFLREGVRSWLVNVETME